MIVYGQHYLAEQNLYRARIHNLTFLAKYRASQALPAEGVSDAANGCIGMTAHKIIKTVIGISLEHLVDRQMKAANRLFTTLLTVGRKALLRILTNLRGVMECNIYIYI